MFCTSCIDYCLVESHTCPLCRATNNQLPPELAELDFLTAGKQIEASGLQYFGRNLLQSPLELDQYNWYKWLYHSSISYTGQDFLWLQLYKAFWSIYGLF